MKATVVEAKHVAEKVPLRFPFANEIPAGVVIASVQRSLRVKRGSDANPGAVLWGEAAIATDVGEVSQRVQGGVAGAVYLVVMTATLSNGLVLVRAIELPVIDFV